jgi:hypothetical protein
MNFSPKSPPSPVIDVVDEQEQQRENNRKASKIWSKIRRKPVQESSVEEEHQPQQKHTVHRDSSTADLLKELKPQSQPQPQEQEHQDESEPEEDHQDTIVKQDSLESIDLGELNTGTLSKTKSEKTNRVLWGRSQSKLSKIKFQ